MDWGISALQNAEREIRFESGNQEWKKRSEDYVRAKRNEEMEGGRSPPPKIREDNLFTDGDSRPSSKPSYQTKEEKNNWGWGNDEKDEPEETLSSLFDEVNAGKFVAKKKRKRFKNKYEWKGEVVYGSPPSGSEEKDYDKEEIEGSSVVQPSPTAGDRIMTTSEALKMLTRNGKEDDEENARLIIKAPKKYKGKAFLVDYCDGDEKDEYHWLQGPHKPEHTTIEDLLERRGSQPRRSRRQQGHTSLRDDRQDAEDPHGKREATPESPPQAVRFERVFWRCPPKVQEPSKVESGECKNGAGEGGEELTIVDIHILGLF
jgi:hypothetical protein